LNHRTSAFVTLLVIALLMFINDPALMFLAVVLLAGLVMVLEPRE
jgi:hypothetical protein